MTVHFESTEPGCSETELEQVQHRIGHRLPEDYLAFLHCYNGTVPEQNHFAIPQAANASGVEAFFSCSELLAEAHAMLGRIPDGVIPIAHDAWGNYIRLATHGQENGAVLFWDHELEAQAGPTWRYLFKVAACCDVHGVTVR